MRPASLVLLLSMAVGFAGCSRGPSSLTSDDEIQVGNDTVLECKLEVRHDESGIFATVIFKNPTDHPERVLKVVLLDEEPLLTVPFDVTKDGKMIVYTGGMASRLPPTKDDWRILKPGETFVRTIRVNDYYDLSAPGEYQIVCERLYEQSPPGKFATVKSNEVTFTVFK